MSFKPTEEQEAAITLFLKKEGMGIEAGAGTGKTSTLQLLGNADKRRGHYLAFNKAIVMDAQQKMPPNVTCSTAHSLAFRTVGRNYAHRLNAFRVKSWEIAGMLGLNEAFSVIYDGNEKVLNKDYLAGLVMRSVVRFCQSADPEPTKDHMPYVDGIDMPAEWGGRTYDNNESLAYFLEPYMKKAWADLQSTTGQLPYRHDHYLKAWHLSEPHIGTDFILFDEAQDANPVMLAVVGAQKHAQLVFVGDSNQAIYEFTGAVNALAKIPVKNRTFLTQSFRFGPAVADVANLILEMLNSEITLTGCEIDSKIGVNETVNAILSRTNATAISHLLILQAQGKRPHLVGGGGEVLSFARAARDLSIGKGTSHPELACFKNWHEVQEYVEQDEQGSELKLLVTLIDKYGTENIMRALESMPDEKNAEIVISTAHKSKGREWPNVQLTSDFPEELNTAGSGELRLLYVAATRGRENLDITATALDEVYQQLLVQREEEENDEEPEVRGSVSTPKRRTKVPSTSGARRTKGTKK